MTALRVPPDRPRYTLRRVWLTPEEEEGYYFGFANEGLWPLCHIAHTRPIFRANDWEHYRQVNRKFADAVLEEMRGRRAPVVLVQDYHFALLPRLIKEARPDARVAMFWHIPWPNPEAFGICPWQQELLDGLLGADLIGFHMQAHCHNFLETVDRAFECRIEWERLRRAAARALDAACGRIRSASRFPRRRPTSRRIGRARPGESTAVRPASDAEPILGVGVDRVDYTKGILERFRGIERFLDKYPHYRAHVHVRADRRAQPHADQALPGSAGRRAGGGRSHQPAVQHRRLAADHAAEQTQHTTGRSTALYRAARLLPGHVAA